MTQTDPWILGLSTGWHNGAACLCHGGEIVVAVQEERLTRVKRSAIQPGRRSLAVSYCLEAAGLTLDRLDMIVDCRIQRSVAETVESIESIVGATGTMPEVLRIPHHLGHALSAFCTSGFDESTVLVIDGGGSYGSQLPESERTAAFAFDEGHIEHLSVYHVAGDQVTCVEKHMADMSYLQSVSPAQMPRFLSLGHMFSAVAHQIFGDLLEAGKVMALAPCGSATIPPSDFCEYVDGRFHFSDAVPRRFQSANRWPACQHEYADLAASVQRALEVLLEAFAARLPKQHPLCYAGGVALNSVANHNVLRRAGFPDVHVIAAAEDSGTAIGAAYFGLKALSGKLHSRQLHTDALGRSYNSQEIDLAIEQIPCIERISTDDVVGSCVDLLCDGHIVAWFQGGAEFGPRALGHRSILCDPRRPDAKETLNRRVKHREAFRPFAPAVLADHAAQWFDLEQPNRLTDFMLEVCSIRIPPHRPQLPAVTHVDGSGRLQTVTAESDSRFHRLLHAFHERTGVPMIVNTSMNVMGEPIVESPRDALTILLFTDVDYLILEDRLVTTAASFVSALDLIPGRTPQGESVLSGTHRPLPIGASQLAQLTAILGRIDGVASFRHILSDAVPNVVDERQLMDIAQRLFRHQMIAFTTPVVSAAAL